MCTLGEHKTGNDERTRDMSGQLHITNRPAYLRGYYAGKRDATAGADYQPCTGGEVDDQRAYGEGYGAGYIEGNPCDNGTCGHLAHAR